MGSTSNIADFLLGVTTHLPLALPSLFFEVPGGYALWIAGLALVVGILCWLRLKRLGAALRKKIAARTGGWLGKAPEGQTMQLKKQAERLKELDQAKSRFIARVSHEFRTPLALIQGPLRDLLEEGGPAIDDEVRRQLEIASRNAQRVEQLIDQLSDLSRLEAGQMQLHRTRGAFVELVRGIVRTFMPMAERRKITLQYCAAVERLAFAFDAEKLRTVTRTLVEHALKRTPAQGKVIVTVAAAGARVVLSVQDTGEEIPPGELPHVFERYHQHNGTPRLPLQDPGFGLSLAKEFVELHGGTIRVESEEGSGAEFVVTLPTQGVHEEKAAVSRSVSSALTENGNEQPQPATAEGAAAPDRFAEQPTVLVVEDHPDVRTYLRIRLGADYRVEEAEDGAEALEKVRSSRPALIISDIMMPVMDGAELCRVLKSDEQLSDVPVILLTAKAGEDERVKGLHAGADDYVEKPFSMAELKARVRNLIENRRALRKRFSREVVLRPQDITITPEEEAFYEEARAVVELHMEQADFSVGDFAAGMNVSKSTLNRRLKAATGLTPAAFIRELRLQRAAQLLEQNARTVAQVAYTVGYSDAEHFSKIFREHFGVPPSAYPADDA